MEVNRAEAKMKNVRRTSALLILRPLPISKPPNKVMIRASLVTIFERIDFELLKNFKRLKHTNFHLVPHHAHENFPVGW